METDGEKRETEEENPLLEETPWPRIEGREKECAWFQSQYRRQGQVNHT